RAVPGVGDLRVHGEGRSCLVIVGAPEADAQARCGVSSFRFAHRAGSDSAASDGVATCHGSNSLSLSGRASHPRHATDAQTIPGVGRCGCDTRELITTTDGRSSSHQEKTPDQPMWLWCLNSNPSTITSTIQALPRNRVIRSRLRSTTEELPWAEEKPPPN